VFISIRDAEYQNNKNATLNSVIQVAKQILPEMFPSRINHHTFKGADKALQKLKGSREAKEETAKMIKTVRVRAKRARKFWGKLSGTTNFKGMKLITYLLGPFARALIN
jgi:hypothetical protein